VRFSGALPAASDGFRQQLIANLREDRDKSLERIGWLTSITLQQSDDNFPLHRAKPVSRASAVVNVAAMEPLPDACIDGSDFMTRSYNYKSLLSFL
jgi:hypothetical protein